MNATETKWLQSLESDIRERVFAAMRAIGNRTEDASKHERVLRPPHGTVGVGAADFDEFIKAEGPMVFLRGLRTGARPEDAETEAKDWAREAISAHNQKRPKDINWARADITGDGPIERARRDVERAG